jgi:hypothetical protein
MISAVAAGSPAAAQTIPREFIYIGDELLVYHVGFADVSPGHPFYLFINAMANLGITGGCGPGLYCPDATITRGEVPVFLLKAKFGSGYQAPPCSGTPMFADVPIASPFCPWIQDLASRGIVAGCGGGNYCPSLAVTRDQMSVLLLLTLDGSINPPNCVAPNMFTDVSESSPFCRWIEELVLRGITGGCGGGLYCPAQPVNRAQMAVFLTATFSLPH